MPSAAFVHQVAVILGMVIQIADKQIEYGAAILFENLVGILCQCPGQLQQISIIKRRQAVISVQQSACGSNMPSADNGWPIKAAYRKVQQSAAVINQSAFRGCYAGSRCCLQTDLLKHPFIAGKRTKRMFM